MRPNTSSTFRWQVALLALFFGGGCASVRYGIGSQPYVPWFGYSEASRATTFQAARRVIDQLGPTQIEVSEREYRLYAVLNDDADTRDLVTVEVHERGELMIDFRTQLSDGGEWRGGSGVCGSYSHGRERLLGERIAIYASAATSEVALAARTRY